MPKNCRLIDSLPYQAIAILCSLCHTTSMLSLHNS
ncbi:MAG: hypothetical protein E8D46_03455 [Nitrospira sp.]|nr:MAG: hypothetical protein E8D46_03455 [Nitrospira sp.]